MAPMKNADAGAAAASGNAAEGGCGWCNCTVITVSVVAVLLLWLVRKVLNNGGRRKASRPARSAERNYKRGTGQVIECSNPGTGEVFGKCNAYTVDEVKAAFDRSRAAAEEWKNVSFEERRATLMEINDWVLDNMQIVMEWSVKESGKTITEAALGEVFTTCEKIRWLVAHGEDCIKPESRKVPSMLMVKAARVEWSPMGVIGIIVPWNYPFHNILSHVSTALLTGNGSVVKVSEWTSYSAEPVETMLRTILARRGHNPDLVQVITGYGETGAALVRNSDKVLFIGSPGVGKLVMKTASENLTPVILELGGKDAFIICDDVDFDHMIDIAIRGAFINLGQNCVSSERFYVQSGVYEKFVSEVSKRVAQLAQGFSLSGRRCDFGAITMPPQADHVDKMVKEAVAKGARLVAGGIRHTGEEGKGAGARCVYYTPTILAGVTHDMKIANEETFGPVMTIIKWNTEDEVMKMANCTKFGLGGSIFTRDYTKAERLTKRLETGMVTVNDFAMVPMIGSLPFGGIKESGFGAFNGVEGVRGFCRSKSVVTDRFHLRADTPQFLKYPIAAHAHLIVQQMVRMVYGRGWIESAVSAARMVKLIISGAPKSKEQ